VLRRRVSQRDVANLNMGAAGVVQKTGAMVGVSPVLGAAAFY
jgi:hypothetical protein